MYYEGAVSESIFIRVQAPNMMFLWQNLLHLNFVKCLFILMAFGMLFLSLLVNFCEKRLPVVIVQTFRYGKFSYTGKKSFINYFEVPKSWFRHFYVIATLYSFGVLYTISSVYIFQSPVPEIVIKFLDLVGSPTRVTTINVTTAYVALLLLCIQVWRRFYETFRISVFSNCKINIIHYFVGIGHYLGAMTAILMESPGFALPSFKHRSSFSLQDFNLNLIFGTVVFLWAWYNQYRSGIILANLRKNEKGTVVTYDHKIPVGGLFDKLSSPHMFCEMLMYLALNIILWGHSTWPYVFLWVFCNQCETALLSHWWYKSKFKSYPKIRRAFLPFIL